MTNYLKEHRNKDEIVGLISFFFLKLVSAAKEQGSLGNGSQKCSLGEHYGIEQD